MSDGLPFFNSAECDDEQPPTAGAPAPRKRPWAAAMGSNASLANLAPSKTCPACSKVHGNAKKGQCKGLLPDGTSCCHVFESAPKQPRLPPGPQQEFVGAVFTHKQLHRQFEKLCEQANRVAQLSGFSAAVMLAGAVSSDQPYTPAAEVVEGDTFVRKGPLLEAGMRLVVFKHSSGGAAKLLVDQWEVLEFLAQRVHFNLTGHLADCAPPAHDSKPPKKRRPPAAPARQAPAATTGGGGAAAAAAAGAAAATTCAAAPAAGPGSGVGAGTEPRGHSTPPSASFVPAAAGGEQRDMHPPRAAPATTTTAAAAAAAAAATTAERGWSVQEMNAQQRGPWGGHSCPADPTTWHTPRHTPPPVSAGSRSQGGASTRQLPAAAATGPSEAAAAGSQRQADGAATGSAFTPWGGAAAKGSADPVERSAPGLLSSDTQQQQQQQQQQQEDTPAIPDVGGSCPSAAAAAAAAGAAGAGLNCGGAGSAAAPLTPSPDVTASPNTGASGVQTPAGGVLVVQPAPAAAAGHLGAGTGTVVTAAAGGAAGDAAFSKPHAPGTHLAAAAAAAGNAGVVLGAVQQDCDGHHQQHQQAYRERQRQHLQLLWQQCQQRNADGVQLMPCPVVQQCDMTGDPATHTQHVWQQQTAAADLLAGVAAGVPNPGVRMVPVSSGLLPHPYPGHLLALGSAELSRTSAVTQAAAAAAGAAAAGGIPPGLQPWTSAGSHLTAGGLGLMSHPGDTSVPFGWSDDCQGLPAGWVPGLGAGTMLVNHPPAAGAGGAGYSACAGAGAAPPEEWLVPLQEQHSSNMALLVQQQQQQGAIQRPWSSPQLLPTAVDTQPLPQGGRLPPGHLQQQQQQGGSGYTRRPSSRLHVMSGPH